MNRYKRIKDFHETRRRGIGASDIPILAGLTLKYGQTPYGLWLVKTGRKAPWSGNEQTEWGKRLEGLILRKYIASPERFGEEKADEFYRSYIRQHSNGSLKILTEFWHPQYRFALAHPDLLIENETPRIVQAKSHSFFSAQRRDDLDYGYDSEDYSQNGIPSSVFLQEQWELFCAGLSVADVAVLSNTNTYSEYGPVIADPRTQEKCLALAERFMWHVENDQEPKPETWADVQTMFPHPEQTTAMVSGDTELEARRMKERKEKLDKSKKRIEAELDDLKNAIGLLIGENSVLASAEGDVLAKSWEVKRWFASDLKKLEQTEPDLFKRLCDDGYITRSENRVLRF